MSENASNRKADQAYHRLRRSLTSGEFAPGEWLTRRSLRNLTEAIRQSLYAGETLIETT